MRIDLLFSRSLSHTIGPRTLYVERILASVRVRTPPRWIWMDGIMDTGSAITLFPPRLWNQFHSEIRWLTPTIEAAVPSWLKYFRGAAGGVIRCRLGFLALEVVDMASMSSLAVDVLAAFAERDGSLQNPLVGLGGGVLDACVFHLDHARAKAWLEVSSPTVVPPP